MEKVIIIGSGPAGFAAAIYTARAQLNPLLIAGPALGGQVAISSEIGNYPGFPEDILGAVGVDSHGAGQSGQLRRKLIPYRAQPLSVRFAHCTAP